MKKNLKKIVVVITLFIMMLSFLKINSQAYDYKFDHTWIDEGDANVTTVAENIMGSAITVIRVVGTGISIIMLTYVAIKYMSAAPSEKAEFKKSATAFIVGAIVLFATTNILGIIADFATTNIKKTP